MWKRISSHLPERRVLFVLLAILVLASFLRLYRISDYMTFLGDEGRDVLVAKHILEGELTFLGPRASAGDFYLGPIYYYFMAPFLFLFNLNPVGPAVMIALFGIATVFLVYYVTSKLVNTTGGLVAAGLYAVSPLVIVYSRSSWNPNLMPPVTISMLYLLYLAVKSPSWKKYIGVGLLFGIALQLHYLELFVAIIIVLFTFLGRYLVQKKSIIKESLVAYGQMLVGFLITFSPFIAFEVKNHFPNTQTIFGFVFSTSAQAQGTTSHEPFLNIVKDVLFRLFGRLLLSFPTNDHMYKFTDTELSLWGAGVIILCIVSIFFIYRIKDNVTKLFLLLWLVCGVALFGFYKKPIYDYYFEFMFPLPFILYGNIAAQAIKKSVNWIIKYFVVGITIFLFVLNLYGMPFKFEPNRQKDQVKSIADFVLSKTDNKPYNFALITPGNSDHGYRYFFEAAGRKPVGIENQINDPKRTTVTDQLLVVCEDVGCLPLGNPLFEVAGFGRAEIAGEWNVSVVKVYKLVHYEGNN